MDDTELFGNGYRITVRGGRTKPRRLPRTTCSCGKYEVESETRVDAERRAQHHAWEHEHDYRKQLPGEQGLVAEED